MRWIHNRLTRKYPPISLQYCNMYVLLFLYEKNPPSKYRLHFERSNGKSLWYGLSKILQNRHFKRSLFIMWLSPFNTRLPRQLSKVNHKRGFSNLKIWSSFQQIHETLVRKGYISKQCLSLIITLCTLCRLLMKISSISRYKVSTWNRKWKWRTSEV